MVVLLLLVIGLGVSNFLMYRKYQDLQTNPQKAAQETVDELLAEVSRLMVLPVGETPTVATVTDPEKLKDQPFFAKAKAGDKVIIYTNARKAIIYSPAEKKIIEVAPVTIGNNQTTQPAAAPSAKSNP